MAPSRQALIWSLPTLALILSILWYRRKRSLLRSDPGGTSEKETSSQITACPLSQDATFVVSELRGAKCPSTVVPAISTVVSDSTQSTETDDPAAPSLQGKCEGDLKPSDIISEGDLKPCEAIVQVENSVSSIAEGEWEDSEGGFKLDNSVSSSTDLNLESIVSEEVQESQCIVSTSFEVVSQIESCKGSASVDSSVTETSCDKFIPTKEEVVVGDQSDTPRAIGSVEVLSEVIPSEEAFTVPSAAAKSLEEEYSFTEVIDEKVEITIAPVASESVAGAESVTSVAKKSDSAKVVDTGEPSEGGDSGVNIDSWQPKMARKLSSDVTVAGVGVKLEDELSALKLDASNSSPVGAEGQCRDSANHSPADVMLASPSMSNYSDAQSEGSSDSGKGGSDVATPPSRTPASGSSVSGDPPLPSVYEFVLPQYLVGRLIGRHGCFVHQIKSKTHANILIKRHPDTPKLKICAIEGTQMDIESALEMIRQKFPSKRYPSVTLEQVSFLPPVPTVPVVPDCLQLHLVEGVHNDVILSSLVSPGHFFLQQPTHPTFPALNRLNTCMNVCYAEPTAPPLPYPVQPGAICAAPTMGGWYRAQVVTAEPDSDMCEVKFIDYGGYLTLEVALLRQIRSDFMTLPFQAAECYLASVVPSGGAAAWSPEAVQHMEQLTQGQMLQAQVCGYVEDGNPCVFLYSIRGAEAIFINHDLVMQGMACWVEPEEMEDPHHMEERCEEVDEEEGAVAAN